MAQINVLNSSTIDQIAAGEVVERPASVVKELVENAIDAGADSITVEVKEGGISLIRVTDNGGGIEKEQVKKAFLRHATSKIKTVEDLLDVTSLGFRGEALSSIAAVSQAELITKTPESLTGIRYCLDGGVEKEFAQIGAPAGTTMLVRNLFYNMPARRKFLKTAATEGGYISDLMEHMAMSKPQVAFQYIQNGQVRFHTSGNGDLKEIIYRIFGRDIAAALIPIEASCEGVSVRGYLGKPELNRSNRNFENYFVNCRYIKSDMIAKAVEEAYKPYLMQHRYPFVALHFTVDSSLLDVNVHPTKMEVRFQNQIIFYEFLVSAVLEALHEKEMIPEVVFSPEAGKPEEKASVKRAPEPFEINRNAAGRVAEESLYRTGPEAGGKAGPFDRIQRVVENRESGLQSAAQENENPVQGSAGTEVRETIEFFDTREQPEAASGIPDHPPGTHIMGGAGTNETFRGNEAYSGVLKQKDHIFIEKPEQLNFFSEKLLSREAKASYSILGQLFDTYWLIAYEDKLLIIDQHAAHEKVKYERLVRQLAQKEVPAQSLNPPVIVTLSGREESVFKEFREQFCVLGFEVEAFGGNEYAVRSVPLDLYGCDEREMFLAVMDELSENSLKGTPDVVYRKLASMACKAAVKGNMNMSRAEMEQLLDELLELDNPYHCPHGRPTMISMSKYEIEKKFKRIL